MEYSYPYVIGDDKPNIAKVSGWETGLIRVQVRRHKAHEDVIVLDFMQNPALAPKIASQANLA